MNSEFIWTPPGLDEDGVKQFLSLEDGIPKSANTEVYSWFFGELSDYDWANMTLFVKFQTSFRKDLGLTSTESQQVYEAKRFLQGLDQQTLAYLVDFCLSHFVASDDVREVESMDRILKTSGAGWKVGIQDGRYRLMHVLPSGVIEDVDHVISLNEKSGGLLRKAWNSAFGINKQPSHAYYDAVRAVEVLSVPLISPKDKRATLGKNISVLQNAPHKWDFVLNDPAKSLSSVEHVVSMMKLLWHSHNDRHGHESYKDVSVAESQAAVMLASTLVGWLSQGMLKRKSE